ncbi:MAG: hypothetical protein EYC70_11775 [Planctomycetota bacterium]|nr:MAG: hypothetical protein EYC70_11775 [Planctomycetota bacterium]
MTRSARMLWLAAALLVPALAPQLPAQKAQLGADWFTDKHNGYRLRYPDEWMAVPVQPREAGAGVVAQMDGPSLATRVANQSYDFRAGLTIMKFEASQAVTETDAEADGGLRGRVDTASGTRDSVESHLKQMAEWWQLRDFKPAEVEELSFKDFQTKHQEFSAFTGDVYVLFDTFTFRLDDFDVALVYLVPLEHAPKWQKVFGASARSFERIVRTAAVTVTDEKDYGQLLAAAADEAARTAGWRVLEVPSQRYILKTSSKDEKFLKAIVERLEASRNLFERDFPPSKPIDHVSVVRVCSNLEEFHKYGKTGGGVAGWFNPGTTELVIVDFKDYDRNLTYGVMTHEAFHQYCHFLFDESEAHRWFDEGHGDYYGAFEFKGNKAICHANMKGESRLVGIRDQIRNDSFTPIGRIIRQNHGEWQSKGVASYEQSWSMIYMLRRGMEGEVPKRLWRTEYADIIPEYMRVLHEGFVKAYEEAREEQKKNAAAEGRESNGSEELWISERKKEEIWDKAIAASWGQVDLEEFEKHWKEYVLKELKD